MQLGWLKKVGQDVAKGIELFMGLSTFITPVIEAVAPASKPVLNDLTSIGQVVTVVETVVAKIDGPDSKSETGPQKLQAALVLVKPILLSSELLAGKEVSDESGFEQGATEIINGVVLLLNSVQAKKQNAQPVQPVQPPQVQTPEKSKSLSSME